MSLIESNIVIDIVSLKRDSPKIIENSFGYRYLSITFSVTKGSILHKAAAVSKICQL